MPIPANCDQAFKVGGMWRFMRVDIEAWIARQTSASVPNKK
jgi:predicted DNA-binding transcriptional regulator AlpA